jgi:hypothetical protein
MKLCPLPLILISLGLVSCQVPPAVKLPDKPAKTKQFPAMKVQNLNGSLASFPAQFPGKRTLLFVAFDGKQQGIIDEWVQHFPRRDTTGTEWLEMPIIPDPGYLMRAFVHHGMRSGTPEPIVRNRIFTIYTSTEAFVKALGLPDSKQVHAVVTDRSGKIIAQASGEWTEDKDKVLRDALAQ